MPQAAPLLCKRKHAAFCALLFLLIQSTLSSNVDPPECTSNCTANGGTCQTEGPFQFCECSAGQQGFHCEHVGSCTSSFDCANRTCNSGNGKCVCGAGLFGPRCEHSPLTFAGAGHYFHVVQQIHFPCPLGINQHSNAYVCSDMCTGTYSDVTPANNFICNTIPARSYPIADNLYASEGATSFAACPATSECLPPLFQPTVCPYDQFHFFTARHLSWNVCRSGTLAPSTDVPYCYCDPGSYRSADIGAPSCLSCPLGTFDDQNGAGWGGCNITAVGFSGADADYKLDLIHA